MKYFFAVILFYLSILCPLHAQLNVSYRDHLDYDSILADLWGYAANGREYALVGMQTGVSIVDVTDPDNISELFFITANATSIWRQIRTWSHYAYIVHDNFSGSSDGLLVVDLSDLPNSISTSNYFYYGPNSKAHTIHIDENGVAYLMGGITPGTSFFDLAADPLEPPLLGSYDTYVHDGYMENSLFFAAQIFEGTMAVIDVSDFSAPILINEITTPNAFTHACWKTSDGNHILTTDEKDGAYITCYNIADLNNIYETDRYRTNAGTGVVPHNVYVVNDNFAWVSYYTAGVVLLDVSNPENIVEVGSYDTAPAKTGGGFDGCWGVYPFLPSGNIIASDRQNGLYVLTPQYIRASYLEGSVTDAQSGLPIAQAFISLSSAENSTTETNILGLYATGAPGSGIYNITFTASGYYPLTLYNISLTQNSTVQLNAQLIPTQPCYLPPANLGTINILNNEIQVIWSSDADAISYNLRYREEGASEWIYIDNISDNSYTITELYPDTAYEIEVSSMCQPSFSLYSNTLGVHTLPGCVHPYNETSAVVLDNSALISWDNYPDAAFYQLRYRVQGSTIWTTFTVSEPVTLLENLQNNTTYDVQIATNCGAALSLYTPTLSFITGSARFRGNLLLQGYKIAGNTIMKTDLANAGLLPKTQPFAAPPYFYSGPETVNNLPASVSDWILLELRDPANFTQVIERRAAFVRSDGVLLDIDGSEGVAFQYAQNNTAYRIAAYHHSHLGILSSADVVFPNAAPYSFSNAPDAAEGASQQILLDGKAWLYAGDYDGNGVINSLDYNRWSAYSAGVNVYLPWDGDGNGVINSLDYNLWYANRSKVGIPAIQF